MTDALFLANRGANGIDGLISSGIGAAHASGRPTTIVTGDLGLLHDLGGLAALREVSTPVRIVVIDNDGGGIFHFLPQESALDGEEFEALLGTPRGIEPQGRGPFRPPLPAPRLACTTSRTLSPPAPGWSRSGPTEQQTSPLHRRLAERRRVARLDPLQEPIGRSASWRPGGGSAGRRAPDADGCSRHHPLILEAQAASVGRIDVHSFDRRLYAEASAMRRRAGTVPRSCGASVRPELRPVELVSPMSGSTPMARGCPSTSSRRWRRTARRRGRRAGSWCRLSPGEPAIALSCRWCPAG